MADKKGEGKPEAADGKPAEGAPKKGPPIKMIAIVAVVMVVEAVIVVMLLKATGPKPTEAATGTAEIEVDHGNETVEIQIVDDRFQNLQTGRVWIWDVGVFVQVKVKNQEIVERELERRNAEILEGISQIIGRAQHAQLKEPERQTLNRQISGLLESVFGKDSDQKPVVEKVLIPKARGFPADF